MQNEFEITVPPGRHHTVELRVRVEAETWLEALAEAGRKLREELGVIISDDGIDQLDRAIRVRDLRSGRQYVVSSLGGKPPAHRAGTSGTPTGHPTLLTAHRGAGEVPTRAVSRVRVQSPLLHRRGEGGAGRRTHRRGPDATRLELQPVGGRPPADRVRTPPAWKRRRPVVRSDQLKPKPRPLHVTTPVAVTGGGTLFKPVTDLDLLPGDVDSLIDAAVTMLADHIPCDLVQAALWLADREGLWVASAKGHLADEVRHAVLRLPTGLIPQGPDLSDPFSYRGDGVALTYEDDAGGVLGADVDAILCAPIRVRGGPLGLFLLAGPVAREGFSQPDASGAAYLAKTIGAKIAATLAEDAEEDD